MPFVPSDLSANAQPPENAVNEQTDRWTDRQTNNNIHKHPWMQNANVQKPENVVNRPIDGQTDGQTDGKKSGRGGTIAGGYCYGPLNLV